MILYVGRQTSNRALDSSASRAAFERRPMTDKRTRLTSVHEGQHYEFAQPLPAHARVVAPNGPGERSFGTRAAGRPRLAVIARRVNEVRLAGNGRIGEVIVKQLVARAV